MIPTEGLDRTLIESAERGSVLRDLKESVERDLKAGVERVLEDDAPAVEPTFSPDRVSIARRAVEQVRAGQVVAGKVEAAIKTPGPQLVAGKPVPQVVKPDGLRPFPRVQEFKFSRGRFAGMSLQQVVDGLRSGNIAPEALLNNKTYYGHVVYRHGPDAHVPGKTRFLRDFDVRQAIHETLTSPDTRVELNTGENFGIKFERTYPRPIARNAKGKPVCTLKVVVGTNGKVITAYGVK